MGMFSNYENNSYTAYNLTPPQIKNSVKRYLNSPIIGYDKYNNPKVFIWDPKDEFSLNLSLLLKLPVLENSVIYSVSGLAPTLNTQGIKGQRAYNIVDGISWLCKGSFNENISEGEWTPLEIENLPEWEGLSILAKNNEENSEDTNSELYLWEKDELLTFIENGNKEIDILPNMTNKSVLVTIMNFRHEVIYSYIFKNTAYFNIEINKDKTPLLVEGQFFINVYIQNENITQQQVQYNVMIIENPNKYVCNQNDKNFDIYINSYTIQQTESSVYTWESIEDMQSEYIWIPIAINNHNILVRKIKGI